MSWRGHPVAVWRLVMYHKHIWSLVIILVNEFYGLVCDYVGDISSLRHYSPVFAKIRRIIVSLLMLSAQYAPMVKSLGFGNEMPFPYDSCSISCFLQEFRKCLLTAVKCAGIVLEAVDMAEFTGQYTRS